MEEIRGVKEKFPLTPLKIPSMYLPRILSFSAPYKWPKFGARSINTFSARQKIWVKQMPKSSLQKILKSRVS